MRYTDSMLEGIRILCRGGIGYPCRCGALWGACPARAPARPAAVVPCGGLAFFVARLPCHRVALLGGAVVLVACQPRL